MNVHGHYDRRWLHSLHAAGMQPVGRYLMPQLAGHFYFCSAFISNQNRHPTSRLKNTLISAKHLCAVTYIRMYMSMYMYLLVCHYIKFYLIMVF